ncbi:CBS domain-containing protein [Chloroflexota bacterium]
MRVRDIMTTKVITVSSNTTISKAEEIMSKNKIRRLPVVDKGQFVGIISRDGIMNATTPYDIPIAPWKMGHYLFSRKVKEIMSKNLVTATPDMTATSAAYLAQRKKVGCLPVLDKDKLVGILTTNDFFYKVLNPLLGIWERGTQFIIHDPSNTGGLYEAFQCFKKYNAKILAIRYIDTETSGEKNLAIRIETKEENKIEADLKSAGYHVEIRQLSGTD